MNKGASASGERKEGAAKGREGREGRKEGRKGGREFGRRQGNKMPCRISRRLRVTRVTGVTVTRESEQGRARVCGRARTVRPTSKVTFDFEVILKCRCSAKRYQHLI